MTAIKISKLAPVLWSTLIFIVAEAITFVAALRINPFLKESQIYVPPQPPNSIPILPQPVPTPPPGETPAPPVNSLGPIILYFLGVILVLSLLLFLVPVKALRMLLRILFAVLFSWGIFVLFFLWFPVTVALPVAAVVGVLWFSLARVWMHNLVMILALVALGAVFGRLISPWTSMILIALLAIYDFVSVRFGFMMWMTKKLTESSTLPAFIIPQRLSEFNASLKEKAFSSLSSEASFERRFSILGGGDIGFPLLLTASTYFGYGLYAAIAVAGLALAGLLVAYAIQMVFLKGKPMPALPPIAVLCLIALLIIRFA
jgi:presenilin-like A22 family membrane protease